MSRQACSDGIALVLWYQPKPVGVEDEPRMYHERYRTCIERSWEPSREQHDHVPIDSIITGWKNNVGVTKTTMVFGVKTERELRDPNGEKSHLYNHLKMINWHHQGQVQNESK